MSSQAIMQVNNHFTALKAVTEKVIYHGIKKSLKNSFLLCWCPLATLQRLNYSANRKSFSLCTIHYEVSCEGFTGTLFRHTQTHPVHIPQTTDSLTISHTHTHTHLFFFIVGTFHRRNGFYTVQTVFSIALHQANVFFQTFLSAEPLWHKLLKYPLIF